MIYKKVVKGIFLQRPNRFVALVEVGGQRERVHVKNTGRCKELLLKGSTVFLEDFQERMGNRKMRFSLVAVEKNTPEGKLLINMDSQAPNLVIEEALKNGDIFLPNMSNLSFIKREASFGDSRFDFYVEDKDGNKAFIEVKGVTLEEDCLFLFPDAPTSRGVKHINQLASLCESKDYFSYLIFLVQMDKKGIFKPNRTTQPDFAKALIEAESKGLKILVYNSFVTSNEISIKEKLEFSLDE